ncbi:MAG: CotH kinase family protein [Lachnospiraceae bacterium]|nr:CotH kinase family protein [Lachnospiraceae bacterium]
MEDCSKQKKMKENARRLSRTVFGVFCLLCALTGVRRAAAAEEEAFVPSSVTPPGFSAEGGFYEKSFELVLTVPDGMEVCYTLDGSEPRKGSRKTALYTGPIRIPSSEGGALLHATVVRAVSVTADGEYSDVQTHTYFVASGMKERYAVPVISIVTDPDSLYDEETGIFVNPTQSGREWERPAHFEYFLPDGQRELSLNIGLRIHGGYSRNMTIKSFRVYARAEYDTQKNFQYDFFSGSMIPAKEKNGKEKTIEKFKRLILRTGGNEGDAWEATYFRDLLAQSLMADSLLDLQAYAPTMTYINGEFYGILNMRERLDDRYLASHYNCSENDITIYDFQYRTNADGKVILPPEGEPVFNVVAEGGPLGAKSYFEQAYKFVTTADMSDETEYAKAKEYFDVDNFIDYLCVQLYSGNTDWPHNNCHAWCYTGEPSDEYGLDGRFRFLVYDLDFGFGLYGHSADENTLAPMVSDSGSAQPYRDVLTCLLRAFLKNDGFREQFCTRFLDLLNTNFAADRVIAKIDALEKIYTPLTVEQYAKYGPKFPYSSNVETARNFARMRANAMRLYLVKEFSLGGRYDVVIQTGGEMHGSVKVNTVTLSEEDYGQKGSWTGKVCVDFPLTISAVPEAGYKFAGWEGSLESQEAVISFAAGEIGKSMTLTPVFVLSDGKTEETKPDNKGEQVQQPEQQGNVPVGSTPQGGEDAAKEKTSPMPWLIFAGILLAGGAVVFVYGRKNK